MFSKINPFVRYISKSNFVLNCGFVVANDCRMLYIISGRGKFITDHDAVLLSPGALVYYPYGMPYYIESDPEKPLLFYTLNFDFTTDFSHVKDVQMPTRLNTAGSNKFLKSLDGLENNFFRKKHFIKQAPFIEHEFRTIYDEGLYRREEYALMQSLHLKSILVWLHRTNASASYEPLIQHVTEFIHENLSNDINNQTIAAAFGYHPYYLNTLIQKTEGISLHKYLLRTRLIKAYELVTTTHLNLAEIAERCGFKTQAHMSAAFKKMYGKSPLSFRVRI